MFHNARSFFADPDVSLEEEEFRARKSANIILWVLLAFVVLFLLWASLTSVDRTVRGMGRIVPSSKLQVVSNLEGGVVEQIYVKAGDTVKRGQILVRLSPTISNSAFGSTEANVQALETKIARLSAEVRGGSPDYKGVSSEQVAVEQSLHSARMAELAGLESANAARVRQAERSVIEARSMLESRQSNLVAAQRELEMLRPLAEQLIVPKIDLIKAENAAEVAENEVAAAHAAVARAQSSVAEARAAGAQQYSDWKTRAGMELSQAQAELTIQRQNLPALYDRVDRTAIRAPMSGKVNRVLVTTVGGTVASGMPVAEIVPSDDSLYVEVMVRPNDIGNVGLGQRARVEITAYNSAVFGSLEGFVTSISPDAVQNDDGESFYTVEVQTDQALKGPDGKPLRIGPGMIANVSLKGEKRSILSYLFTPITRLSENAFRE
ncbi:HlyD family type I secretion periplasmic adaptor subunit [Erythrobacter mangrovi]|uniref:Membrane fusion protein (MFP) family protein n=1 Tax=Erythrobacter mangrovi TaxID=2739433 RepID=A0A7D4BBV3_9SPHN|nr:HlyD family type I secretion periplasmic adaptor subunit [Erythrobacter mangrovi]QKG72226.1 HlyD family type I secretion periplasmic adaptor subunit [Erythrobacter mangrovi]